MSSQYKSLRCNGCDGTLEYNKEKKAWVCIYCGNEIRREEEYDGLYTIKNVVRQVLVDLAYGRLDAADKNLIECEKIASDYVGTLIAGICVKVFTLITPGACQQSESRGLFRQVKIQYERLQAYDAGISSEEEALYESFDGKNDAFGVLLLVFDTLGAKVHLDFVNRFFDASGVYSSKLNANLLAYAFKHDRPEMIDQIFSNMENINCKDALWILLNSYQDGEKKQNFIPALFERAAFQPEDYKTIEAYIGNTKDSTQTKIIVYSHSVKYRIAPAVQAVIDHIMTDGAMDENQIRTVIAAFCDTHPKDAELYDLVEQIYTKHSGFMANFEMDAILESGLFVKLSERTVCRMLGREDWPVSDRISMLEKSERCKLDARANDAILADLLLRNQESTDVRLALVSKMTVYVETVSTAALTDFILKSAADGERKPEVLAELLKLNLNMSFFREVLSRYLQSAVDSPEVKKEISQMLSDQGLQVDSGVLLDMACGAQPSNYMETADFIQKALQNGTRLPNNALSIYMERVPPQQYHHELISLLHTPASQISDQALACYVLYAEGNYEIKVQNSLVFGEQNGKSFGASTCQIRCLNAAVQCNLFQAYVLITEDSAAAVEAIVNAMKNAGAKLNPTMLVNGQQVKFKKFVTEHKSQLSPTALQLCEQNKVFSMFF